MSYLFIPPLTLLCRVVEVTSLPIVGLFVTHLLDSGLCSNILNCVFFIRIYRYKFVIKEYESSHVPEGISAPKTHFVKKKEKCFTFKCVSCEVVTCDIRLASRKGSHVGRYSWIAEVLFSVLIQHSVGYGERD